MNLDFAVIGTTIIGFVLVVWVLGKYAWGPILEMLDARREKISSDFAEADQARGAAERIREDLEVQMTEIKVIERTRIQEAAQKGEQLAERIKTEAQEKAQSSLAKAQHDIEVETQKAQMSLRDQVVDLALRSSEMLVKKELDDDTHRKLIKDYIDGLGELPNA